MGTRNIRKESGRGKVVDDSGQELCTVNYSLSIDLDVVDTVIGSVEGKEKVSGNLTVVDADLFPHDAAPLTLVLEDGTKLPVVLSAAGPGRFSIKKRSV